MRGIRFAAGLAICAVLAAPAAQAFCGFYVGGADSKLFNNATQVALMRDGNRTVLSMQNNYQGPPDKFAMVIPVPVVLQKENVKTLKKEVFDHLDQLTAPRLVEYWEQDPCYEPPPMPLGRARAGAAAPPMAAKPAAEAADLGVTVEAQFSVGEYDIVILSAKDSSGLETWLHQEQYEIPKGAEPYFRPYVAAGSKFFVAKVDPSKVTFKDGQADLSPLRFHYDTPDFQLPVRLGLINSNGTQDLVVQILAENKRYEPANYPSVTIPTNFDVAEEARDRFGSFYAALFDKTIEKNPKAIVTEYSWAASTCDPCPGPALSQADFLTLGADALDNDDKRMATVGMISSKRIDGDSDTLVAGRVNARLRQCYQTVIDKDSKTPNGTLGMKLAWKDGKITTAEVLHNDSKEMNDCLKGLVGTPAYGVKTPGSSNFEFSLTSTSYPRYRNFTVTRLHARYSKDALGADIVFKEAPAIVGGRETRDKDGNLEHGSAPGSVNNFQARYAIRHPWTGPIECKEPKRGIWGGPPAGKSGNTGPTAAQKLASVPRGGLDLTKIVKGDVAELDLKGAPATDTSTETKKRGCAGCSTTPANVFDIGALGALVAIALRAIRRKRA